MSQVVRGKLESVAEVQLIANRVIEVRETMEKVFDQIESASDLDTLYEIHQTFQEMCKKIIKILADVDELCEYILSLQN